MSSSNGNGKFKPRKDRRHARMLYESETDTVALGYAVEERFLKLCKDYLRLTGEKLPVASELDTDMLLWRTMMVRFKKGDYRNNKDELNAVKRIAQWTVDVNNQIRNQPQEVVEWKD